MASLCHPWFTTTNLSYRFPIFETSATALCGTTGTIINISLLLLVSSGRHGPLVQRSSNGPSVGPAVPGSFLQFLPEVPPLLPVFTYPFFQCFLHGAPAQKKVWLQCKKQQITVGQKGGIRMRCPWVTSINSKQDMFHLTRPSPTSNNKYQQIIDVHWACCFMKLGSKSWVCNGRSALPTCGCDGKRLCPTS